MLTRLLFCLLFVCAVPVLQAAVSSGGTDAEQQRLSIEAARNERMNMVSSNRVARENADALNLVREQQLLDLRKAPLALPTSAAVSVSPIQRRNSGMMVFGGIVFLIAVVGVAAAIVARRQIAERDRVRRMIRHIPLAPSILMLNHLNDVETVPETAGDKAGI